LRVTARSGCARLARSPIWGLRGREFRSRQPDKRSTWSTAGTMVLSGSTSPDEIQHLVRARTIRQRASWPRLHLRSVGAYQSAIDEHRSAPVL
jgi:hypothetical protein